MIFDALPYDCWRPRNHGHGQGSVHRYCQTSAGAVQIRGNDAVRKDMRLKLHRLEEALRDEEFDLSVELVRVLKTGDISDSIKARLMATMLEFVEPKLKSTTITVNNRPVGELTEAELRALAGIIDQDSGGAGTSSQASGAVIPFRLRAADEPVSDAIETPRLPTE